MTDNIYTATIERLIMSSTDALSIDGSDVEQARFHGIDLSLDEEGQVVIRDLNTHEITTYDTSKDGPFDLSRYLVDRDAAQIPEGWTR